MVSVLHFTDMHLRQHQPGTAHRPQRLSREMPGALRRLTTRIEEHRPDIVVLTGDILDVPDEVIGGVSPDGRDLEIWRTEVVADYRLVKEWIDGLGVPSISLPGNHDLEGAFAEVFPDRAGFRDVAGLRFFSFWDNLADDRQPERIGKGAELFEQALSSEEHAGPQVHLQHYMIDPVTVYMDWRYDYKDAARMKQRIEAAGRVRAVLSGHLHPGSLATGPNHLVHSVAPAFSEAPHPFRIYDIEPEGEIRITDHALDTVEAQLPST